MNASRTRMMMMMRRSERYLELQLKEAEGYCRWRSLSATSRSWKVDVVKGRARDSTTIEEENLHSGCGFFDLRPFAILQNPSVYDELWII